jgi:pimeloyl-ACP methyl ester carboxylesterase
MTHSTPTHTQLQHVTAEVNDTALHYVTAGASGDPVLLVHGFPETWTAFGQLIPLLAEHHRVYAVDLRGFGDSAVADEHFSSAVAAEDLHALVAELSVGPMHVVGQDLSGSLVYRLARLHPEDVLSLTAVESGLAGFGAERLADVAHGGAWYIGALAAPGVAGLLFESKARAFIGEYLYPMYGMTLGAEQISELGRTYGRPGGFMGAAGLYRSMLTEGEELRALAAAPLTVPVAAVGSRGEDFTRSSFGSVTSRTVPAMHLEGVGHYVAQEAPDALADILLGVFADARAAVDPH